MIDGACTKHMIRMPTKFNANTLMFYPRYNVDKIRFAQYNKSYMGSGFEIKIELSVLTMICSTGVNNRLKPGSQDY